MVQLVNTRGCQFQLTSYGDKGAGLVALVDIQPGTLLISEPAILRVTLINGDLSSGASKDVNRQFSRLVPNTEKGDFEKFVAAVVRLIGFKLCREISSHNETY